jgi:hypothetical protein
MLMPLNRPVLRMANKGIRRVCMNSQTVAFPAVTHRNPRVCQESFESRAPLADSSRASGCFAHLTDTTAFSGQSLRATLAAHVCHSLLPLRQLGKAVNVPCIVRELLAYYGSI